MIDIQENKAVSRFPQLNLMMGAPKIGKSTIMAQLPQALVLDLEGRGYNSIDVKALSKTTTFKDVKDGVEYFFSPANKDYSMLVIDHLRQLTSFMSDIIASKHNAKFVEEIPYGQGTSQLKKTIRDFFEYLVDQLSKHPEKRVFIVAHSNDKNNEIRLDVDGKNETMILGLVDSVGHVYRDGNNMIINFESKRGSEFGTRNSYLSNYQGPLDWKFLFNLAEGNKEAVKKAESYKNKV